MLALAMLATGALVGFLFGIPRSALSQEAKGSALATNTNIEKVSDWLTTIIVGLTLTNLNHIPALVRGLAWYFAVKLGGGHTTEGLAAALIVYFCVVGFFLGYLATRLYLTGAFALFDSALSRLFTGATIALQKAPLSFDAQPVLTGKAREDVKKVRNLSVDELDEPSQLGIWARASLALGKTNEAIDAYSRALALEPNNPELRIGRAVAAHKAGLASDQVFEDLETAYKNAGDDATLVRRAVEGLMLNYLRLPPPRGFDKALAYGTAYVRNPKRIDSAAVWAYLAAAYGQRCAYNQSLGVVPEELQDLRAGALEAIKNALALDHSWKPLLSAKLEGDLVSFRDDPEFLSLLRADP